MIFEVSDFNKVSSFGVGELICPLHSLHSLHSLYEGTTSPNVTNFDIRREPEELGQVY